MVTEGYQSAPGAVVRCPLCMNVARVSLDAPDGRPPCVECGRPILLDRPIKVDESDFDETVLSAEVPVLVDVYADWCAPCKMVAPLVDELAREHMGRLLVGKVDSGRAPALAERFGIRGVPTLIMFKHGHEIGRSVGFDEAAIRDMVAEALTGEG